MFDFRTFTTKLKRSFLTNVVSHNMDFFYQEVVSQQCISEICHFFNSNSLMYTHWKTKGVFNGEITGRLLRDPLC